MRAGSDPLAKADISLELLLGEDDDDQCSHQRLDSCELVELIVRQCLWFGPQKVVTWRIIIHVLKESQAQWWISHVIDTDVISHDSMDDNESEDEFPGFCTMHSEPVYFGNSHTLPLLWAAIQTELLTYGRLEAGSPWISPNFGLEALDRGLSRNGEVAIALVQNDMMRPVCECGKFQYVHSYTLHESSAVSYDFTNMDGRYHYDQVVYLRDPL